MISDAGIKRLEPTSVPALIRQGNSLLKSGRLGPAFRVAQAIVRDAPADVRGYLLAAEVLEQNQRMRAALGFVARGLAVSPGHKQLSLLRAKLLRLVGDVPASVEAYEALLTNYPWSASVKVDLALALLANGEAERALPMLEEASQPAFGTSRSALRALVLARLQTGDFAGAREAYERIHNDSHYHLLAALPDGLVRQRLASADSADALAACAPELVELAAREHSSPLVRAFLHAAGDVAGLAADRAYHFPRGLRAPKAAARLDRALASAQSAQAQRFVDPHSSLLGLTYRTTNIGDDVQSLAALNLTGKVGTFVERDRLDEPGLPGKIVLNGWWGHDRSFPVAARLLSVGWPPRTNLDPLFVAFHLDPLRASLYLTPEGIEYLKQHEPIGCRDGWTQRLLERCGIRAYFSGCLTLTLPRYEGPRKDRVLLVDLPERVVPLVSQAIARHCKFRQRVMTHDVIRFTLDPIRRLNAASSVLGHYARSAFVVTTRLHVALPCVAMGTPVLFLPRDARDPRFDGLSGLLPLMALGDAIEDASLFDPARWPARMAHLALRDSLINRVRTFVACP